MSVEHTDIASYSLGLLNEQERLEFDDHLADCPACQEELAEFAAMADLFVGVDPVQEPEQPPDESAVVDLLNRQVSRQRKRNRQRALLAAAACLVLLAGGILAGRAVAPGQPSGVVTMAGIQHQAVNPASGIKGIVGLTPHPWGTQVILQLSHVRGPLDCELIAVSRSGQQRVMVGWLVPATGYGVSSHPADLLIEGGTSIQMNDLASIKVQVRNGPTLLNIGV
jgi:putative zinc finger protein